MFLKFFKIDDKKYLDVLSTAGTVGLHLVAATFVGLAIGYFLDKWLGTSPWLLIFFLLVGIAAGYKNIYQEARRIQQEDSAEPEVEQGAPGAQGTEEGNDAGKDKGTH
jgi:ATP synthase protein I